MTAIRPGSLVSSCGSTGIVTDVRTSATFDSYDIVKVFMPTTGERLVFFRYELNVIIE